MQKLASIASIHFCRDVLCINPRVTYWKNLFFKKILKCLPFWWEPFCNILGLIFEVFWSILESCFVSFLIKFCTDIFFVLHWQTMCLERFKSMYRYFGYILQCLTKLKMFSWHFSRMSPFYCGSILFIFLNVLTD